MVVLKGLEGIGCLNQDIGIQNICFLHGIFSFSLQKFDSLHNKTAGFSEKAAQSNALPPENRLMLYRQYARKSYRAKSIGNPLHIFIIHLMYLVFHITGVNYL